MIEHCELQWLFKYHKFFPFFFFFLLFLCYGFVFLFKNFYWRIYFTSLLFYLPLYSWSSLFNLFKNTLIHFAHWFFSAVVIYYEHFHVKFISHLNYNQSSGHLFPKSKEKIFFFLFKIIKSHCSTPYQILEQFYYFSF